jgi:uncharacterized protein (DUF2249 family)
MTEAERGHGGPPAGVAGDRVVELDVRDDLRQGREPFQRIMEAKDQVPEGGALMLRAIFEPAPLYRVLRKQGFEHRTEQRGEEDWVIWFWKPAGAESGAGASPAAPAGAADRAEGTSRDGVRVLDVRGLEPPEPLVRTLAALEEMPRDHTLVHINVREPKFLLPQLEERGFEYEIREQAEDLVRVFIRHTEE